MKKFLILLLLVNSLTLQSQILIKDGVLKKYPCGDGEVYVPQGITSIECETDSVFVPPLPGQPGDGGYKYNDGKGVFEDCESLVTVHIPSSVVWLGTFNLTNTFSGNYHPWGPFSNCINLTNVYFDRPSSLKVIGWLAFNGCESLTSITIPSKVVTIGASAFSGCSKLTSVTIPATVNTIGTYAFSRCTRLRSVYMYNPTPPESLYPNVFLGVDKQNCILYVPKGSGNLYRNANQWKDFVNIIEIDGKAITVDITKPGKGAYSPFQAALIDSMNNNKLSFTDISGLTIIRDERSNHEITGGEIHIINEVSMPSDARVIKDMINLISLDISGVSIFSNTVSGFSSLNRLVTVTIPGTVTVIGKDAFRDCKSLEWTPRSENLQSIGDNAFMGCSRLERADLKYRILGLKAIGKNAFYECESLSSILIPASVTSIGDNPFGHCSQLTEIEIDGINNNFASESGVLFSNDKSKILQYPAGKGGSSYVIPSGVTEIGYGAFSGSKNLYRVEIPLSVNKINNEAFEGCTNLSVIYISNPEPIQLEEITHKDVFSGINQSQCILYVPAGSLESYRNARYWKDFNIKEYGPGKISIKLVNGKDYTDINDSKAVVSIYKEESKPVAIAEYSSGNIYIAKNIPLDKYYIKVEQVAGYLCGWYGADLVTVWPNALKVELNGAKESIDVTVRLVPVPGSNNSGNIGIRGNMRNIGAKYPETTMIAYGNNKSGTKSTDMDEWIPVQTVSVDSKGDYVIAGLLPGDYLVMPDLFGYTVEDGIRIFNTKLGDKYEGMDFIVHDNTKTIVKAANDIVSYIPGFDNDSRIELYPNPFVESIHIKGADNCLLKIVDIAGAVVYSGIITDPLEIINTNNLSKGVYLFHLTKGKSSKTIKAVKY